VSASDTTRPTTTTAVRSTAGIAALPWYAHMTRPEHVIWYTARFAELERRLLAMSPAELEQFRQSISTTEATP
jgi:hypothetical protein